KITRPNSTLPDETACWQAVVERDPRFDGVFYYAVRSTNVYCRPSCPSRRPSRRQVIFFARREQAEAAGFRPCKRCQPQFERSPQAELVAAICRLIEQSETPPTLRQLGEQFHLSPFHLQRLFKMVTGVTPRRYAIQRRTERFKAQLRNGQPVTEAVYAAGYGSSSRLYEGAGEQLGMTPAVYRAGGKGMNIEYTIVDCPLGRMLVAATERGVCAVSFGGKDAELEKALHAEYPQANIQRGGERLNGWVQALLHHLAGTMPHLDLPLDVQASAFQRRVWEELRRIPYGERRSYAQIAEAIGQPKAVRAVARACAANPAAVIIPCHRVLRSDGTLGGYRWGLERKKALLEKESEPEYHI
ncbi:MAG: bifunctional DNA-binding transcriptional regulator/O6-methylguanine-DNA methyltransferase Ada, partial [Anaerolineales bacterium]